MKKTAQELFNEHNENKQKVLNSALGDVLKTTAGRVFLRDLIFGECHVEACTFLGNSTGYFEEGKRAVGLKLVNAIKRTQPKLYLQMVEEELNEEATDSQLKTAADAARNEEE